MSLFDNLRSKGLWRGYTRQVVQLEPILVAMSQRGMPISSHRFARINLLLTLKLRKAKREMQALVPNEIKRFKIYKKTPKKVTEAHFQVDVPLGECPVCEGKGKAYVENSFGASEWWCEECQGTGIISRKEWKAWLPWSPSNKGLLAYIKFRGHKVPRDHKKNKETTAAIEIRRLSKQTGDPLYRKVLDYRQAQTVLSNHMENWKPGLDSRVHSTFYFDPATGQLSSRRPNVQNAPKHDSEEWGGYGKLFRSMIIASPGCTLIEFDFKSFHAQTLAFEAEDKDYLRLAKLDIHSFLAAHLIKEPRAGVCLGWPDDELREYLKWIKKNHKFIRDKKAKPTILGYGFGLGWFKLWDMNKESFDSQADAKRTLAMLDACFPVTKAWRDTIRAIAHEQGYLISRFGFIRYFWEVFKWQGRWIPGGEDSEAAIAFLPANDAFGHMREVMLAVAANNWDYRFNLVNNIHDSLLFDCPNELVDECREKVHNQMELPSPMLVNSICPNGLSVEVDVQGGPNWSSMKEM